MSGRDVRRLAARATNMTHEAKRDIVARVAAGADAMGVSDIYITREPYRIASMALEWMPLKAKVHVLDIPLTNTAQDTEAAIAAFKAAGCDTVVSLGGDGTNRAIVRQDANLDLVPLSTGTNNVFPDRVEPTLAGMIAGLNALGRLQQAPSELALSKVAKVLRLVTPRGQDLALVDAVMMRNDRVGNMLPFEAQKIETIVLTRAEPNAIGMSPIGGFVDPVSAAEDQGLVVHLGPADQGQAVVAPLSPGWFQTVYVKDATRLSLGDGVTLQGPGVIALDGDRDHKLLPGEVAQVHVQRDGPRVLDVDGAMRWVASQGMMRNRD
jgi:hypothetical protein